MASRINFARNRNSWGPISVASPGYYRTPDEDDDDDEIKSIQAKQLDPLKEDLADWLNKSLGIEYINKDNFLEELDNGVVLCHLAQIITDGVKKAMEKRLVKGPLPKIRGKCFEKAARGSFFSRDNMENFIRFCRSLGVHENLLFESEDLVLHNQPRNVILCLLEVARIASKFGLEPPGIVQLEKQIAEEERDSFDSRLNSLLSWQFPNVTDTTPSYSKMKQSHSAGAISSVLDRWNAHHVVLVDQTDSLASLPMVNNTSGASDGVPSDNTEDEEWSRGSGEDPDLDVTPPTRPSSGGSEGADTPSPTPTNELDRKVQLAARLMQKNCNCASGRCDKLRIRKVGEGKYNIAGKNVFVRLGGNWSWLRNTNSNGGCFKGNSIQREDSASCANGIKRYELLKGRHMMVRVGGGWDTLDHFLLRHDPCQVKVVSRESPDRPTSASKYLHIRAKYRSPPPRESITR